MHNPLLAFRPCLSQAMRGSRELYILCFMKRTLKTNQKPPFGGPLNLAHENVASSCDRLSLVLDVRCKP